MSKAFSKLPFKDFPLSTDVNYPHIELTIDLIILTFRDIFNSSDKLISNSMYYQSYKKVTIIYHYVNKIIWHKNLKS